MPKKIENRGKGRFRFTFSDGYDANGKQVIRQKTVPAASLREAQRLYNQFAASFQTARDAEEIPRPTLIDFYAYWKANYSEGRHELTTRIYNEHLFKRVKLALGPMKIDQIKPNHLLKFYRSLEEPGVKKNQKKDDLSQKTLAPLTIQKYHKFLSALFAKAVQWDLLTRNPCKQVDAPTAKIEPKEVYTTEELEKLLRVLSSTPLKYQLMTYLGLAGALRREEIFGLEWKHISFEQSQVHIEQAAPYVPGHPGYLKPPKTKSSRRIVSLSAYVMELFKKHQEEQTLQEQELANQWIKTERVFTQWNGTPSNPCSFSKWLTKFVKENDLPHLTPHGLRHWSATYLTNLGVDIRTISGRLGHSRTSTTTDIYSHLIRNSEQESAKVIGDFLEKAKSKPYPKKPS